MHPSEALGGREARPKSPSEDRVEVQRLNIAIVEAEVESSGLRGNPLHIEHGHFWCDLLPRSSILDLKVGNWASRCRSPSEIIVCNLSMFALTSLNHSTQRHNRSAKREHAPQKHVHLGRHLRL